MAKGSKRSNRSDARPSALTPLRSRPPLEPSVLVTTLKAPASGPARTFKGTAAKYGVEVPNKPRPGRQAKPGHILKFHAPQETLVCVRRHRRKEVLHALKKTGKSGQRKPRRSHWRNYKC